MMAMSATMVGGGTVLFIGSITKELKQTLPITRCNFLQPYNSMMLAKAICCSYCSPDDVEENMGSACGFAVAI